MRRAFLVVAVLFPAAAYAADQAPRPALGFIGEGGGSRPTDPTTESYLVGDQKPPPVAPSPATSVVPAVRPLPSSAAVSSYPAAAVPASKSVVPSVPASVQPAATKPAGAQSLWNGLVQPLSMTGASAAAADPDSARAESDRDYETRILGMKAAPERGTLAARPASGAPASSASLASARAAGGKLFVSLALDPSEAGSLRDAVAGLGASVGFSADARFQAVPGPNGTVLYSGWLPAARLGEAAMRPGVKSVRVETVARPSTPGATSGEFLVGLRVDDAVHAWEGVNAGVKALAAAANFRLTRVVGLETAPDGRSVAVVSGTMPLSRLSRAMALDEVAKIAPAGGDEPSPAAPVAEAQAGGLSGFASFAVQRWPWLILLTLLLLLPGLREPVRRAVSVFTPYR